MSEPSHHQLLVPKAEAKKKLTAQIKKGREILAFLSQPAFDIPFPSAFKQAEERQTKWAKYTIDLLKRLIRDHDYLIHVEFGSAQSQYPPNQDQVEAFQEQMNKRIQCLESIVERLPLFTPGVAKGTSAQSDKGKPVIRGLETAKHAAGHMKVFISWSGDLSHRIALSLREWLPVVLPFVEPWVSSEDIRKGVRWSVELNSELENTHSGIVCLVPDNIKEPWLYFEAGALSKSITAARIHPFLVGLDLGELPGPLAQFQATYFSKDDIRKLIHSLNSEAEQATLPIAKVDKAFDFCWPSLESLFQPLLIESFKDLIGDPPNHLEAERALTAEELKVLNLVANSKRVYPRSLEEDLGLHRQRIQHIMETLEGHGLLYVSHNAIHGPSWSLSKDGRAFLVKKNIL